MVDHDDLHRRLMATFVEEVAEHVASINRGVLQLETGQADQREETVTRLFRAAHSLKGAARAVDVQPLEEVCHRLEDIFTVLRDSSGPLGPEVASRILAAADSIASAGELLRQQEPIPADYFREALDSLTVAPDDDGAVAPQPPPDPDPDPDPDPARHPAPDPARHPVLTPPAAAVEDEPPHAAPARSRLTPTVRVDEEKLDGLMAEVGELLIARQRMEARPEQLDAILESLSQARVDFHAFEGTLQHLVHHDGADPLLRRSARLKEQLQQTVAQTAVSLRTLESRLTAFQRLLTEDIHRVNSSGQSLQENIHRVRMVAFSEGCAHLERAVRDVAQATGKQVRFELQGGETELDRTVVQGLRDPLLHLIRNAVDHGLETPAERQAAGKPEAGRLCVSAVLRGSQVDITVADDGRGLDRKAIARKRAESGLPPARDDQELFRSIFLPGFSTAAIITDVSGRGVGMDVVKAQLESLHGTLDLRSEPGLGTRFSLCVPLTLTTISAVFVRTHGAAFAVPTTNVSRLIRFRADAVRSLDGQPVLSLNNAPTPIAELGALLRLPEAAAGRKPPQRTAVVLTTGDRELIVAVDELIGESDAVTKSLGRQVRRLRHISGATILNSGEVALVLNVTTLMGTGDVADLSWTEEATGPESATGPARILVADDSVTTRSLLRSILEAAGFDVTAAVDGTDAWQRLQTSEFDILVSDVDMPGLDGFQLTEKIRACPDLRSLPVILVTSRDTEKDKARGVQVGADAYLVKSSFQQSGILDAVEQLL